MNSAAPRFRRDLLVTQQRDAAGPVYVLKHPETGQFFRFRVHERFITEQLDGETPLDAVRQRVRERFGERLSSSDLASFLDELERHGLLERDGHEGGHMAFGSRARRMQGSTFYLRFKAFDPDRILNRLEGRLRFLFTRWFVAASAAVILAAGAATAANWDGIVQDLGRLYRLDAVLFVWITLLLVGMAHEFAHGLTCKHFGGEVHEMGFMLIYFQPALYCNVSDAWLFPERWKRLWVTFAGAYFELFVWGLATLAWRVTEPDAWLNLAALVVVATSGVKTLFNFNPLIKLDGYYLLSDYLEVPNLRKRSFKFLGRLLRGRITETSRRERWIFLTYGILAGIFTLWLLGYMAVKFGGFLIERYQAFGLLLFSVLFLSKLRAKFSRFFRAPRALMGLRERFSARKRPAVVVAAAGIVLVLLFLVRLPLRIAGEFSVLPVHNADVRSEVEGLIEEVLVGEGDVIRKGAPIARLSDRRLRADLGKAEASIAERRARLRMLTAGPTPEEIELARRELATARMKADQSLQRQAEAERMLTERRAKAEITVGKAEVRVKYALMNLDRLRELKQVGLVAALQYEQAEEQAAVSAKELEESRAELSLVLADTLTEFQRDVKVAEMEVGKADAQLAKLLAGSRKEEIEATQAEIAAFEAERRHLQAQMDLVTVTSPITGVVTTPARELKEMMGKLVKPGDLVAEVHELELLTVEIAIPEKEIAAVRVGQPVTLKARAYPDRVFHGEVTSIATTVRNASNPAGASAASPGSPRTVRVTTRLENRDLLLKPEMTGKAKIAAGNRRVIDLLTRRLSRFLKVEFWSWW